MPSAHLSVSEPNAKEDSAGGVTNKASSCNKLINDLMPVSSAGKTILWMLLACPEGRQLVAQHPEWLNSKSLNKGPTTGDAAEQDYLMKWREY